MASSMPASVRSLRRRSSSSTRSRSATISTAPRRRGRVAGTTDESGFSGSPPRSRRRTRLPDARRTDPPRRTRTTGSFVRAQIGEGRRPHRLALRRGVNRCRRHARGRWKVHNTASLDIDHTGVAQPLLLLADRLGASLDRDRSPRAQRRRGRHEVEWPLLHHVRLARRFTDDGYGCARHHGSLPRSIAPGGPSRPSPGAGWRGGHGWRRRDHRGSFEPMPRAFALALIALLGCPSATPRAPTAGGGVSGGPTGGGGGSGSGGPTRPPPDGGGGGDRDPTPPVRGATPTSCPAPSCVFHAGTVTGGTYQVCTASGAGACFHFGPRCAPADGCMFDPASQRYRACAQPSEGACASFGASCTPAGGCAFDPRDGQHRTCEQWSDGRCTRWGAACAP